MKPWYASVVAVVLVLVTLVLPLGHDTLAQQRVPVTPTAAAEEVPAVLLTTDVIVRAGPDNQSARLGTVPTNTIVPVNGRTPDGKWWQILFPGGPNDVGWFASTAAQPNKAAASVPVTTQNLVVAAAPKSSNSSPAAGPCTYDAAFVGDVTVPDFTVVAPGQTLNKVWRLQNSGTCAWDAATVLTYIGGIQVSASSSVAVPQTPAGGTVDLGVNAVAPGQPGAQMSVWQLRNSAGQLFGPRVTVVVNVEAPAAPTYAPFTLGTPVATVAPNLPYQLYQSNQLYQPGPTPTLPALTIDFWSDDTHLDKDHCSTIHWDVEGAQGVYVRDDNSMHGTTGHGSSQVCPTGGGRTYTLRVVHADGSQEERNIRISIN
jgi:hypothetical protein